MKLPIKLPFRGSDFCGWPIAFAVGLAFGFVSGSASLHGQESLGTTPSQPEVVQEIPGEIEGEWVDLFDGKTLEGWVQRGGRAEFEVEDGSIVGRTKLGTPNSFLCTEKDFSDFELELEFRVDNPLLNSGVQFRSESKPDIQNGRVHGYQVEIDPSTRGWTGGLYDEGRRGWLLPLKNRPEAQLAFRLGQWNQMRIIASGSLIRVWINDIQTAELEDSLSSEGFIALQIHSTDQPKSMETRWRRIRLRELPTKT